jgi:DNA-binding transcriptional ArsR family regulator
MARTPTTYDPFNAVAEPRRRRLLETLGPNELAVNELVERLDWPQPMVSKHLAVLKKVGLVSERRTGRLRNYRVNPQPLKSIFDWTASFQELWAGRLEKMDEYLQVIKE